jgi:hypothetical protein
MEKLKKLLEKNPQLRSSRSEYLVLAVKEGDVVKSTGPHRVKLLGCEGATKEDYMTGKKVRGVNLLFEEKGEKKKYFVPLLGEDKKFHYLIERFAEIEEGTELILEYKRKKGSPRGFIDVQIVGQETIENGPQPQENVIDLAEEEKEPMVDVEPPTEEVSPEEAKKLEEDNDDEEEIKVEDIPVFF